MLQPISALPFDLLSQRFPHLIMSSQATGSTRMIQFLAWVEVHKRKLLIGTAVGAAASRPYPRYPWPRRGAPAEAPAPLYQTRTPPPTSATAPARPALPPRA